MSVIPIDGDKLHWPRGDSMQILYDQDLGTVINEVKSAVQATAQQESLHPIAQH
jgi:hypothetical protein